MKKLQRYHQKSLQRSNQSGSSFATAKTHKPESIEDISLDDLKSYFLINQTGTYNDSISKVTVKYLSLLSENEFSITDTVRFPQLSIMMNFMKMFLMILKVSLRVFLFQKQ